MVEAAGPRRQQFSSCDACRTSRVACDAARLAQQAGKQVSCTRCNRRKRKCTFEWIDKVKKQPTKFRRSIPVASNTSGTYVPKLSPSPDPINPGSEGSLTFPAQNRRDSTEYHRYHSSDSVCQAPSIHSLSPQSFGHSAISLGIKSWLLDIFEGCCGRVLGFWLGKHCNPLVNDTNDEVFYSPVRVFSNLDAWISEDQVTHDCKSIQDLQRAKKREQDHHINSSLDIAIQAFTARWLHLVPGVEAGPHHEDIVRELWRESRREMLKVINRFTYRSVLTLFLFGLTPIPTGISDEEEQDGISSQVCVQVALQQVQRLRERQRNTQFNGAKVSPGSDALAGPPPSFCVTPDFINSESRAHWAALIFDTSSSLTLNFRSSLTSGLHGVHSESTWRTLDISFKMFHGRTEEWRRARSSISDEMASQAIGAGAACKLYVWKMIAVLKEGLREGDTEEMVQQAWENVLKAVETMNVTFRPLLDDCQARISFLGQVERLNWYELMLHYHLGILILVDAMEAAGRADLVAEVRRTRFDAENQVLEALKFGLANKFTIQQSQHSSFTSVQKTSDLALCAPFVAIDPYPNHIVASVQLMNKVINREYRLGTTKKEACRNLQNVLLEILEHLPQTSKSVQEARQTVQASINDFEYHEQRFAETSQWTTSVYKTVVR